MKLEQNLMLTDWFPPDVKPVRVGLYEVKPWPNKIEKVYSYWNGRQWGFRCEQKFDANLYAQNKALGPIGKWRGLAKKP